MDVREVRSLWRASTESHYAIFHDETTQSEVS
jgi:hypothetical protein